MDAAERVGERPQAAPGPSPLPCLNRNNCDKELEEKLREFTPAHRKTAYKLKRNIEALFDVYGINRLGFLTLTFRYLYCPKEASRRLHNFERRCLNGRYAAWIWVRERQGNGSQHFHLVIVLDHDIRSGVDFDKLQALLDRGRGVTHADWVNAGIGRKLFEEWAFLRRACKAYGIGRHNLVPIRSNVEGMSKYVGKYVSKHIEKRAVQDKGVRMVGFGGSPVAKRAAGAMAWASPGATLSRLKLGLFVRAMGCTHENYRERFKEWFGPKWMYHLRPHIKGIRLASYPTWEMFLRDFEGERADNFEPVRFPQLEAASVESIGRAVRAAIDIRGQRARKQGLKNDSKRRLLPPRSVLERRAKQRHEHSTPSKIFHPFDPIWGSGNGDPPNSRGFPRSPSVCVRV